jgi:predicted  nucleic acid-binding Zn-ribbon protein
MTDDGPDNLVLRYLRRIDEKVDRLGERMDDVTGRLTAVEVGLNAVRRDLVNLFEADARLQVSVDRQGARLERIEQRLDLRDS